MDFMDIVLMPKLTGTKSKDPTKWWDSQQINLLTDWDLLSEQDVTYWQWCINKRFGTEDQVSSTWLKAFPVGSCFADLVKEVNKRYYKLDRSKRGGITYLYFVLTSCFQMTREAKKAILQWLAWWKSKGLSRIPAKEHGCD